MRDIMKEILNASAILILIAFYAIYFGKMLLQKRKGIQTDQIARSKEKNKIYYIELLLKIATYVVVIAEVISIYFGWTMFPTDARITGVLLGIMGVLIFAIAVWTMRDSWRAGIAKEDKTEMVTAGIYRYSRNPAFVGFDFVYIGILIMYFNPLLLFFSVFAIIMLHLQILQEEAYLSTVFGADYEKYCNEVYRYLGRKKCN